MTSHTTCVLLEVWHILKNNRPPSFAMQANNPMLAINALLSNGRSASELHRLVDQAVAVQPRQLPGSRVPSGLPSSFPQPRIAMQPLSAPLISPTPFLPSRPPMQQLTPQLPSVPQQQQQQQQAATSSMTMTTRRYTCPFPSCMI